MDSFLVYAGEVLIGATALEWGDPPMGGAFGALIPEAAYEDIRSICIANWKGQAELRLSVKTSSGVSIPCVGVAILDANLAGEPAEVNVIGIPYPLYGELFPAHVVAYQGLFEAGA